MKIIALIRSELKRLTATSLARLAFVALMIVPLLYGGAYLWANQNPYAKLDHIPAAIVNLDAGAKDASGDPVDYGDKVTKQLVDAKTFDWHVVSAAQAAKGIRDETYNFVFTIPASFSKDLSSTGTQDPTPAAIDLTTNDTTSYLSSTIADQAGTTIRATVTQEVSKQAASTLLVGLSDIRSNLTTAASGSGQLVNGSKQLKSGIDSAKSGAATLAAGAGQVAAGNAALNSAVSASVTTANATLAQLPATLSATAKEQQAALDSAYTKAGLSEAQENAINQVIDASHASTAATTTAQAKALTAQLSTLQTSTQKLQGGSAQVASGAASLSIGLTKLDTGAASLVSGTTKLNSGLDSGLTQIPATTAATRDKQANAIANPVSVHEGSVASAGSYGAGLAPFFISLAAWIGMYALFLIIKPISKRAITAVTAPARITVAGWLTPAVLGLVQMLALFAIVTLALGFSVSNPVGMIAIMVLASVTFAAIIMTLNVWLGSVGQFLGLVLMLIQLVTAGGTFPWQTLPAPLAALHHVLPMSYAVDGIRQLMYGGSAGAAWADAGTLACWLVAALLLSFVAASRMTRSRTLRDLRPSLIG